MKENPFETLHPYPPDQVGEWESAVKTMHRASVCSSSEGGLNRMVHPRPLMGEEYGGGATSRYVLTK